MRFLRPLVPPTVLAALAFAAFVAQAQGSAEDPALDTAAIDRAIELSMAEQKIPGLALAIVHRGRVAYAKGYGKANIERDQPVTPDTVFAVASVSKPLLALGVARLVEQGRLAWSDPIARHLPGTPASWSGITLAHLANHTSGIVRESPAFDGSKAVPDFELVAATYNVPLAFPTGSAMQYCNVCYFALAEVIARTAQEPWPKFMEREVFGTAGAADTRTTNTTDPMQQRASSYDWRFGSYHRVPEYVALRPSGAFVSTVNDLARIEAALVAGRIVRPETLARMEEPARLNDGTVGRMSPQSDGYGLGWEMRQVEGWRRVGHGGSLAGFRTQYARYPDAGWAVIVLSNGAGGRSLAIEHEIARLLPRP